MHTIDGEKEGAIARGTAQISQVPWGPIDVVFGVAAAVIGTFLVLVFLGAVGEELDSFNPWALSLLELVMLAAAWNFGVRKYRVRWRALGVTWPTSRRAFVLPWLALLGSLVFTGVYSSVVAAAEVDWLLPPPVPGSLLGEGLDRLLNILVIGLLGPFVEEVFFRGFVLAGLTRSLGVGRAVVVSSALFGISHGAIGVIIPVFVTGLLLSWLYVKTKSVWPPVLAHSAQNLLALAIAL